MSKDEPGRYRYEATIRVVVAADSLDEAQRVQSAVTRNARSTPDRRVVSVSSTILDLHYIEQAP